MKNSKKKLEFFIGRNVKNVKITRTKVQFNLKKLFQKLQTEASTISFAQQKKGNFQLHYFWT